MARLERLNWRALDNTAKIFPATSNQEDERVFRFSCQLKETIDGSVLQKALDEALNMFPMFLCVLRKGFFWFYLEERKLHPLVEEENQLPCRQIYVRDQKNLLFRVNYYKCRINLEVFHALTDGTGALEFLKTIVYQYLKLQHPDQVCGPDYCYDATNSEKEEDSFKKYFEKVDKTIEIPRYHAYQLEGRRNEAGQLHLIEGSASVSQLLTIAREHGTTMTVLLTAVYLQAIGKELAPRQKRKVVSLMVPVNLRNYFPSESARNFFGWIDVGYDFGTQSTELEDMIPYITDFFKKELTKERMAVRVNKLVRHELNPATRVIPLELKILGLKLGAFSKRFENTAVFSNMGRVVMPKECRDYVELFDIFTSTPKMEMCMCSYEDKLVMSFTSGMESTNIQRNFFRSLTAMGIEVTIRALQE